MTLSEGVNVKARIDHEERGDATYDDAGVQVDWAMGNKVRLAAEYLAQ